MPNLTRESRAALVELLWLNAGQAETTDPRLIFPVVEHIRALEPEVVLIVGDRGAGKTQLVSAFAKAEVRSALVQRAPSLRMPVGHVEWTTGWPLGKHGPDDPAWRLFARDDGRDRDDAVSIWYAYLLRVVSPFLDENARERLKGLLEAPGVNAEDCLAAYKACAMEVTASIDALDDKLFKEDKWVFVAYDELDTLVRNDWHALGVLVRGLVSFWASYARRWRRLRPKVFLRSDFYRHHREIAGADVAKLAANRVELRWSDKNLYGALCKHILNKRDDIGREGLYEHFKGVVPTDDDPTIGHIPRLSEARDAKPFVDRLVSEFMGPDKKKGLAFTWLLDHLRDGNERAMPRTLVWLIEFAAEKERQDPRATGGHLLHHVSVRKALDDVSRQHYIQAVGNEFRWLAGLGDRLQRNRKVPWDRAQLRKLVAYKFDESWGNSSEEIRPPGLSPDEVIENLVELGVLRARTGNSFDVPDLYLAGLGLVRRGGVARE
jgi:hypothetical protein